MTIADTGTPWAIHVAALSARLSADLARPDYLASVATRVVDVAGRYRCTSLVGASEAGRVIVEAARRVDSTLFESGVGSRALIVDGLLATGTNLALAAEQLRLTGAATVVVVAALAHQDAAASAERELGAPVVVLEVAA